MNNTIFKKSIASFDFKMNLELKKLCECLSSDMDCLWQEKDNEYFGSYLVMKKKDTQSIIRIFELENGFKIDIFNGYSIGDAAWFTEIVEMKNILEKHGAIHFEISENFY